MNLNNKSTENSTISDRSQNNNLHMQNITFRNSF